MKQAGSDDRQIRHTDNSCRAIGFIVEKGQIGYGEMVNRSKGNSEQTMRSSQESHGFG